MSFASIYYLWASEKAVLNRDEYPLEIDHTFIQHISKWFATLLLVGQVGSSRCLEAKSLLQPLLLFAEAIWLYLPTSVRSPSDVDISGGRNTSSYHVRRRHAYICMVPCSCRLVIAKAGVIWLEDSGHAQGSLRRMDKQRVRYDTLRD
jgi:hypothetical protein